MKKSGSVLSIRNESIYGDYTLRIEDNSNVLKVANRIYESGLVEYAHPNFLADINKCQNDPLFPEQYYLNNTGQFGGTAGIDINVGSHGQQCAGIIAATTNNALGIAGIAQCSQIIPINIFNGGEAIQDLVAAIDWAWNQGQADVLSN